MTKSQSGSKKKISGPLARTTLVSKYFIDAFFHIQNANESVLYVQIKIVKLQQKQMVIQKLEINKLSNAI